MLQSLLAGTSNQAVLAIFAIGLIAGLARGFSGFGAALIFVPLASSVIGPKLAAPLLLVVDGVMSVGFLRGAWRLADKTNVFVMAIGALVGVPLGTYALAQLDPLIIRWSIIAIVVMLLLLLISGWRYDGRPRAHLTVAVGAISGLFSGAAQVGGPPVVAYWLGGGIPGNTVRANIILYFAVSSAITAVSYLWGGLITVPIITLAIVVAPSYGVGLWLGAHMFGIASETTFRRLCFGLIALSALISLPVLDGILR
ncbi:sulfite exporter TauE/SafE family protein [Mesorhizobium retamae]|uniref:Probable membrane transporter protein n=1 Tax=Mesorhizobium retamae TaxID=2912854 RepID=A0ABS9QGK3_9HYPH|nr:sulfite exporter TauE/SafE family protein [Mesorhizobium sp. IRAMC:0171]MCG7506558.1 sulfite exporter TauE/SafE family protein [Mesorhizobium sp. IRAMC:0171]